MMMALIIVSTVFIHIPTGIGGYINGGDVVILASTIILGYWSIPVAGIASGMADFMTSYNYYIPASIIIKSMMAFFCTFMFHKCKKNSLLQRTLIFSVTEIIMIAGYFLYEWALFGVAKALSAILFNIIQAVFAILVVSILYPALENIKKSFKL